VRYQLPVCCLASNVFIGKGRPDITIYFRGFSIEEMFEKNDLC
jgi:hypothetical protein